MNIQLLEDMSCGIIELKFYMPYHFIGYNFSELKNFNRLKFEAYQIGNFDYMDSENISNIDFNLANYYVDCFAQNLIPSEFMLKLIQIMLIDIASSTFTSYAYAFSSFFNKKYLDEYLSFFKYIYIENQQDFIANNIRLFVIDIFIDNPDFDLTNLTNESKVFLKMIEK